MKHTARLLLLIIVAAFITQAASCTEDIQKARDADATRDAQWNEFLTAQAVKTQTAQAIATDMEKELENIFPTPPSPIPSPQKPSLHVFFPPLPGLPINIPGYNPTVVIHQWWGEKSISAYLATYQKTKSNGNLSVPPVAGGLFSPAVGVAYHPSRNMSWNLVTDVPEMVQVNFFNFKEGSMEMTPTADTTPVELSVTIGEKSAASRMEADGVQKVEVEFLKNFSHVSIIISGLAGEDLLSLATEIAQEAEQSIPAEGAIEIFMPRWENDQVLWTLTDAPAGTPSSTDYPAFLPDADITEWDFEPVFGLLQNDQFTPTKFAAFGKELVYLDLQAAPPAGTSFALGFFDTDAQTYVSTVYGLEGGGGLIKLLRGTAMQLEVVDRVDVFFFFETGLAVKQYPVK